MSSFSKALVIPGEEYKDLEYALRVALERVHTLIRESEKPDVSGIYLDRLRTREKSLLSLQQRVSSAKKVLTLPLIRKGDDDLAAFHESTGGRHE